MQNLLITGGEQNDRINEAIAFAQKLLCRVGGPCFTCIDCQRVVAHTHPNIVSVSPQSANDDETSKDDAAHDGVGTIKIDQVRRIIIENQKANFEVGMGIFIITHMHKITTSAANALLKVMEENHPQKIFVALAPSRKAVLPTIASRLISHPVKPVIRALKIESALSETIQKISKTPKNERLSLCAQLSTDRESLLRELDELSSTCHAMLRSNLLFPRLTLEISSSLACAKDNLKKNLNPRLVTEQLILREWPYSTT